MTKDPWERLVDIVEGETEEDAEQELKIKYPGLFPKW